MVTKNSTTVILIGTEQTVQFDRSYPYFWVQNLGDSDVLISMDSGITAGADGVITVPAGGSCSTMHGYPAAKLYLLGSGKVQVMGTGSAFNPFRNSRKGGVNKSDFDALSDDVELLGARFDNAVAAVTTDTELVDIRLGVDGSSYPTAGAAVRGQVSVLRQDLESNYAYYEGIDLTAKFSEEIEQYSDVWQWIRSRIKSGNFAGIHVADYIPWTTTDGKKIKSCVAGINTYKWYGDSETPNHIDFISKDLWPTLHVMNPVNYNNGVTPIETLSGDGNTTVFVLTNEMAAISKVTVDGTDVTEYTYDLDSHTITFTSAPASGTNNITITGKGSEYPWLSSDMYLYLNSLKGHVPNGTGKNPPVKLVDYTNDGVLSKMPDALKNVIVTKRALLPKRYSTSGTINSDNGWGWENEGKLWIPSEMEVYGTSVWGNSGYGTAGFSQYPYFNCNMRRVKGLGDGGVRYSWWLLSAHSGSAEIFASVYDYGSAVYYGASTTWIGMPVCFRIS